MVPITGSWFTRNVSVGCKGRWNAFVGWMIYWALKSCCILVICGSARVLFISEIFMCNDRYCVGWIISCFCSFAELATAMMHLHVFCDWDWDDVDKNLMSSACHFLMLAILNRFHLIETWVETKVEVLSNADSWLRKSYDNRVFETEYRYISISNRNCFMFDAFCSQITFCTSFQHNLCSALFTLIFICR